MNHSTSLLALCLFILPFTALHAQSQSSTQSNAANFTWTGHASETPLPAEEAFVVTWRVNGAQVEAQIQPQPGYYLYKRALNLLSNGKPVPFTHNPGVTHYDEHFGDVEVFFEPLFVKAQVSPAPQQLTVRFQGCKKDSVCYPPMQRTWTLPAPTPASSMKPSR